MDRNIFGGLIIGAALGFLIALLTAPEEGYLFRNRFISLIESKIQPLPAKNSASSDSIEEELH